MTKFETMITILLSIHLFLQLLTIGTIQNLTTAIGGKYGIHK